MRRFLFKYAALPAVLLCGALFVSGAYPATLSLSYESTVTGYDLDADSGMPYIVGTDSCSESQELSGPLLSLSYSCGGFMYNAGASAAMVGEVGDVDGFAMYWASASESGFGTYPYGGDTYASIDFHLEAGGFFYIAASPSTIDITFTAVNCFGCLGVTMTVNGITGLRAFENVPTFTPIRYLLEMADSRIAYDGLGGPESILSYNLEDATITDPATGNVVDGAEIRFGVVPVPEPGAAALCCIGLALIGLFRRKRT